MLAGRCVIINCIATCFWLLLSLLSTPCFLVKVNYLVIHSVLLHVVTLSSCLNLKRISHPIKENFASIDADYDLIIDTVDIDCTPVLVDDQLFVHTVDG